MKPCAAWYAKTPFTANDLIYPIFVEEEVEEKSPVESMPGVSRIPEKLLEKEIEAVAREGVKSVVLFGVSHHKDGLGSDSCDPNGLLARMIAKTKRTAPEMIVIADICFCEYTDHGHCGVVENGKSSE